MFNYYRFIRSRHSEVSEIIRDQAAKDKLSLRIIESVDAKEYPNTVTIVLMNDIIVDIYRS